MQFNVNDLLIRQEINGLSLGDSESDAVNKIGEPEYWEGQPNLAREQSQVWIYDSLQITFDDDRHVIKMAVYFDSRGNSQPFPNQFSDVEFTPKTILSEFVKYLNANDIAFDQQRGEFSGTVIRIADGAAAVFKQIVDFKKSMTEEKRITSEDEHLVSIVAGGPIRVTTGD